MPHLRIHYPSDTKGQLYIPLVNNIMWVGCIFIVLLFQNSERMESAYGLAITVTMLMTTTLLTSYIAGILKHKLGACVFALLFGAIELCFFASCLTMFFDGGYVMIFLAALLFGFFRALGNVYTGFSFLKAMNLPSSLYNMLPYIISLIVLAFTSKNSRAPKAEGIPYDKGMR